MQDYVARWSDPVVSRQGLTPERYEVMTVPVLDQTGRGLGAAEVVGDETGIRVGRLRGEAESVMAHPDARLSGRWERERCDRLELLELTVVYVPKVQPGPLPTAIAAWKRATHPLRWRLRRLAREVSERLAHR